VLCHANNLVLVLFISSTKEFIMQVLNTQAFVGKTVLITGGAGGIGAQTALSLANLGANIVLSDIDDNAAAIIIDALNKTGAKTLYVHTDVSDVDQVNHLFTRAIEEFGRIDVVLNNAGVEYTPTPTHLTADDVFMKNIDINLKGVWYCVKAALNIMLTQKGGQIINVASVAGLRSAPMISGYSATKHAVVGLTKSVAVEYARANIRVNAICPSFIDTPMVQRTLANMDERGQKSIIGASPMKRLGNPQEIANAIVWLASDESSFMNGHCLTLDGGMLA
jgi:NAD(P)-dependent dehydrogenase (short-subunit alcohol dehydrogenase family)